MVGVVRQQNDCPERLWSLYPWRYSKSIWMWPQATCLADLAMSSKVGPEYLHRPLPRSVVL